MLPVIAQISIETETTSGTGPSFNLLASWIAGTAMAAMLVFFGFGIYRIVKGKNTNDSEATRKGFKQSGISLGGAIILGTTAGAVAWSADNETYNVAGAGDRGFANLLPAGARPQEVTVQRQGALVSCASPVTVETSNSGWFGSSIPDLEEHDAMERILVANGVLEETKTQIQEEAEARGRETGGGGSDTSRPSEVWTLGDIDDVWGVELQDRQGFAPDDSQGSGSVRLSSVQWFPVSSEGGCTNSNHTATSESTITVEAWFGREREPRSQTVEIEAP